MALNCNEAQNALEYLADGSRWREQDKESYRIVSNFIADVSILLAHNSIKQTPALFKAKK